MRSSIVNTYPFSPHGDSLSAKPPVILKENIYATDLPKSPFPDAVMFSAENNRGQHKPEITITNGNDCSSTTTATSSLAPFDEEQNLGRSTPPSKLSMQYVLLIKPKDESPLKNLARKNLGIRWTRPECSRNPTFFFSVGIGFDQRQDIGNGSSATNAATQAVRDAMDRFILPPAFEWEDLVIHVKLGVPPQNATSSNAGEDPQENSIIHQPMDIDIDRVARVIPLGRLEPIEIVVGGLSSHSAIQQAARNCQAQVNCSEEKGSSNVMTLICCVVAFVTIKASEFPHIANSYGQETSAIALRQALDEKEEEFRGFKEATEWQAWASQIRMNKMEQQLSRHDEEKQNWECQMDLLRKRIALRDESFLLLANNAEALRSQLRDKKRAEDSQVLSSPAPVRGVTTPQIQKFSVSSSSDGSDGVETSQALVSPVNVQAGTSSEIRHLSDGAARVIVNKGKRKRTTHLNPFPRGNNLAREGMPTENASKMMGMSHSAHLENRAISASEDGREPSLLRVTSSAFYPNSLDSRVTMNVHEFFIKKGKNLQTNRAQNKMAAQQKGTHKHLIHHDYHDYSKEVPNTEGCMPKLHKCHTGVSGPTFPEKLHRQLEQIEADGLGYIFSWQPHGRSFKIHKLPEFLDVILPKYFVMTKKSSLFRQLNLYGFKRFSCGPDKGSYYHEKFLRGMRFLTSHMIRTRVNGNGVRPAADPGSEPNLYLFTPMPLMEKYANIVQLKTVQKQPQRKLKKSVSRPLLSLKEE